MELQATAPLTLATYSGKPSCFDACVTPGGDPRPGWKAIGQWVESLGSEGLSLRELQLQHLVRDGGATFTVEGESDRRTRPWKLATLPHVIASQEFSTLERGLRQRVRLLEAVLADLLGPRNLIRDRVIPPELLWSSPGYQRVYHELPLPTDDGGETRRLTVTGTDLAQSVDGSWMVLGDRTRAPSGLGYLLENRIVTSQVHSQLVRRCNVRRVAPFFVKLRSRLQSMATRMKDNPRIAIWTPGPQSYRYFEDSYLARYLGYTLVMGSDLAVRGDRLHLKTLGGLLPIEVLWRHVSDRLCDPLELDPSSKQGVTGLLRTVRRGSVAIANALGSELVQMPALLPFLPAACRHLMSEELLLPSVETYWCGQPNEWNHVRNHFTDFVIRPAFVIDRSGPRSVAAMTDLEREQALAEVEANPRSYVAQRAITPATTPVWEGRELQPWHVSLRCFQTVEDDDVHVLPGGLARVSPQAGDLIGSPTAGWLTLDCWVTADQPTESHVTLLPGADSELALQRGGNELPSRVAEHLFWLGRYVERCESIARLLRTTLKRLASEDDQASWAELPRLTAALAAVGQIAPDHAIQELGDAMPALEIVLPGSVFSQEQPEGLQAAVRSLLSNAEAVRDRLSVDGYRILRRIGDELSVHPPVQTGDIGPAIERLNRLVVDLLAFAGLSGESMTRTHGWRFLQLGRRMERSLQTAELLSATLAQAGGGQREICEAVLETTDSVMTYRSRYMNLVRTVPVIDLLVTDTTNPRSIAFQLVEIDAAIGQLPREAPSSAGLDEDQRLARQLRTRVVTADPSALASTGQPVRHELAALLDEVLKALPAVSDALAAKFFFHTSPQQALTGGRQAIASIAGDPS